MVKTGYLFFILSICFSCSSLKLCVQNEDKIELSQSNINLLNGKFANDSFLNKDSIQGSLYWNFFDRGHNSKDSVEYIKLEVLNTKKIKVSYFDGDTIVRSKVLKGKIRNGYFEFHKKYLIIPALYVNVFRNRSFRISILTNGNLITDYNQVSFGTGFFIIPFYENVKEFNVEFMGLKE